MIHNPGAIGLAILVVAALLMLACLFRKPRPAAEASQDEPQARAVPQPVTGPAPAPVAREVEPQDIRPYAGGAVTLGESDRSTISVRDLKEAGK